MPAPDGPLAARVFALLADGRFHSGEELAQRLEVSRSAVWKAARALRTLGLSLQAVRNRGYSLERPVTPLDAATIRAHLPRELRRQESGKGAAHPRSVASGGAQSRLQPRTAGDAAGRGDHPGASAA